MNGKHQFLALFAAAACAVSGAVQVSPQAASNDLAVARCALGDGNWYTAAHRAENASQLPSLRTEARLVQLEALARSGKVSEIPSRLESWGNPAGEPFRYWRAFALMEGGKYAEARALLKKKFAAPEFARLAEQLAAQLEHAAGDYKAASVHFAAAAALIPTNDTARVENALAWALNCVSAGDEKGAREVLAKEGALEAKGSAGDAARLLAADVAAKSGDAEGARSLRERIVADAGEAEETPFVQASLALAEEDWLAGSTNSAIAFASNAVARASRPELKALAGFDLGFRELAVPDRRTNGIARISALVREDPDAPGAEEALMRLADALLSGGEAEEALQTYDRFLQVYPVAQTRKVHVLEGRGLAFMALKRATEAVGAFARAAQMATNAEDRARCQFRQGDALVASGRFTEAADVYGEVAGTNIQAFAQFQRADALSRAKLSKEASDAFRAILDGGGEYAVDAGLRLAAELASAGRTTTAIDIYNRLLGEKAGTDAALLAEGAAASAKVRPLPALTPEQRTKALENRGRANYRVYRFEDAERDFTTVAQIDPARSGEMRFFCSLCRYGAGRDDEAYASARTLLEETPDSPLRADLLLWLGKFDFAQSNYAAAFAAFEACSTNQYMSTARQLDALVRAARCMLAQQSDASCSKAIEILSRVVAHPAVAAATTQGAAETPVVAEALLLQGETLVDLARFDEAALVLERVSRLPVSDDLRRRAASLRADCLFARGADNSAFYQKAVDAYRTILQDADLTSSMRLVVSFKLARTLEKMHNYREARDQYYTNVVMAYVNGMRRRVFFDGNARALFARAAFILADFHEQAGESAQAEKILRYVVEAKVPASDDARQRIARIKKERGTK